MREWLEPLAKYLLFAAFAVIVFHQALASQAETRRFLLERRRIRIEIGRLRRQNGARERIRAALASDPFYVERMLRERHGYRLPGEDEPGRSSRRIARAAPDNPR